MRERNAFSLCISILVIGVAIFGGLIYMADAAPDSSFHHIFAAIWALYTLPLTAATIALLALGVRRAKRHRANTN